MKYLAFDFGGTNIKYSIIFDNGEMIHNHQESVPGDYESLLSYISEVFQLHRDVTAVCISSPGIYDRSKRVLSGSSALDYIIGKPIKDDLSNLINVPISIENDGNCALLGENWMGSCRGMNNVSMYVIGSAVGGSLLVNGEIIRGAHFNAGELGYSIVETNYSKGKYGSLGGKIGFNGLINELNKMGYEVNSGVDLFRLSMRKTGVESFVKQRLSYLAVSILSMQYIIDPDVIVVGGGVCKNKYFMDLLSNVMEEVLDKRTNYSIRPKIVPAKLGGNANMFGAVYALIG